MYAQKVYGQLSLFGAEKSVDKNEYSQKMNNYSSELAKQTEQISKVISFADYFLPHTKPQTENKITKHTNKERSTKVFALTSQEEIYAAYFICMYGKHLPESYGKGNLCC